MKLQSILFTALTVGLLVSGTSVHATKKAIAEPLASLETLVHGHGLDFGLYDSVNPIVVADESLFCTAYDVAMVTPAVPMGIVTAGLHATANACRAIKHATIDNHPYYTATAVIVPVLAAAGYMAFQEPCNHYLEQARTYLEEARTKLFQYSEDTNEQIVA